MVSRRFSAIERQEDLHLSNASFLQEERVEVQPREDIKTADTKTLRLINAAELIKATGSRFANKGLKGILDDFVEQGNVICVEDMDYSVSLVTYASDPEVSGPRCSIEMPLFHYVRFGQKDKICAKLALSPYFKP